MSKVTIPTVGTLLTLRRPWTFGLYPEQCNSGVWKAVTGDVVPNWNDSCLRFQLDDYMPIVFSKGTVLAVDRIYIRPLPNVDYILFRIVECPGNQKLVKKRLWAKLCDVNNIDADWNEETVPRRTDPIISKDELEIPAEHYHFVYYRMPQELWNRIKKDNDNSCFRIVLRKQKLHIFQKICNLETEIFAEDP